MSKIPSWFKWGLSFSVVALIILIVPKLGTVFIQDSLVGLVGLFVYLMSWWPVIPVFYILNLLGLDLYKYGSEFGDQFPTFAEIIIVAIAYFIIGAITRLVIGKIKKRKNHV